MPSPAPSVIAIESTSGAVSTERIRVGDRVEHAIERARGRRARDRARRGEQPRRAACAGPRSGWRSPAISLYLVAPSLLEVLGSWSDIDQLAPLAGRGWRRCRSRRWPACGSCSGSRSTRGRWRPVIASQLAGNALSKVAPGGGAIGAALQYKMLVQAGIDRARAVAGADRGQPARRSPSCSRCRCWRSRRCCAASSTAASLEAAIAAWSLRGRCSRSARCCCRADGPLAWVGRTVQRVRNRLRRGAAPPRAAGSGCCASATASWRRSARAGSGRCSRRRSGAGRSTTGRCSPRWRRSARTRDPVSCCSPSARAQVLAQIPVTPGGLGFVEAGLTAMLALAGVGAGDAVLATFAYRLFSYWLPLPLGLVGAALHRRRYGTAILPFSTRKGADASRRGEHSAPTAPDRRSRSSAHPSSGGGC